MKWIVYSHVCHWGVFLFDHLTLVDFHLIYIITCMLGGGGGGGGGDLVGYVMAFARMRETTYDVSQKHPWSRCDCGEKIAAATSSVILVFLCKAPRAPT